MALGGLRSRFGFFTRNATPEPVTEPMISSSFRKSPEEDRTLVKSSPIFAATPLHSADPPTAAAPVQATGNDRSASKNAEKPAAVIEARVELAETSSGAEAPASLSQSKAPAPEAAEAELVTERVVEPELSPELIPVPAPEPEAVEESAPKPVEIAEAEAEVTPVVELEPAETEAVSEIVPEQTVAAEPESQAVPVVEQENALASESAPEAVQEPTEETELVIESAPEPIAAPEPAATATEQAALDVEPEPAAEPVSAPAPVAASVSAAEPGPRQALKPQRSEEEKAAARLAARQKKLDEGSEESPFSVIVGQVYDGPLDLLLDLIRKQDIDIYDIPIAIITSQFLAYVNQLRASDVDVAGDFIYTASLLIHIKSKMLLPQTETGPEQVAEDPRRELVERLLEHERFKNAAQMLLEKQMLEAATWSNPGAREFKEDVEAEPEIAADTVDLVRIFRDILERARNRPVIDVEEDSVTVGQMIQFLARRLTLEDKPIALRRLLSHTHSERALIAMFLALLEMVRLQAILLRQDRHFSEIFIKKHAGFDTVMNEGLGAARDDWR